MQCNCLCSWAPSVKVARGPLIVVIAQIPLSKSILKSLSNEGTMILDASEFIMKLLTVTSVSSSLEMCLCICHGHSQMTLRLITYFCKSFKLTDTKVCSFWWCVIATISSNKDCTAYPQGHGDGVGE